MGGWYLDRRTVKKPTIPESLKRQVQAEGDRLVEEILKPQHIEPPPPADLPLNYITDIHTKWHRSYFYFCSTYTCPGPNAIAPSFESCFARLEYVGGSKFNLAFMRHTGKWVEIYQDLSLEDAIASVRDDPFFHP